MVWILTPFHLCNLRHLRISREFQPDHIDSSADDADYTDERRQKLRIQKQNTFTVYHEASMSALLYRRLWENLSYKARFSQRRQGAKLAEGSNRFVPTQLRCVIVERNESHPARNKFRQADA